MSQLATTPLDPARPMWQFHLVDNYDGGCAVIVRIHHCYADGIALVRVMLSMTDASANGPPAMPFAPQPRKRADAHDDVLSQLFAPLSGVMSTARKVGSTLVEKGVELWADPDKAVALVGQGTALTGGAREARADAAGFADALQGQAGHRQARRVDGSARR